MQCFKVFLPWFKQFPINLFHFQIFENSANFHFFSTRNHASRVGRDKVNYLFPPYFQFYPFIICQLFTNGCFCSITKDSFKFIWDQVVSCPNLSFLPSFLYWFFILSLITIFLTCLSLLDIAKKVSNSLLHYDNVAIV